MPKKIVQNLLHNDRKPFLKKLLVSISLILVLFSVLPVPAQGAGLIFGTHSKEAGLGKAFEIGVYVNTEGEVINAVESKVIFPADSLELLDIRDGNSILNFWLERPRLEQNGKVSFAGVIPGGFIAERGYLFSLVFRPKKEGAVILTTTNEKILLNDGKGTPTTIRRGPLPLNIVKETKEEQPLPPFDSDLPELFTPIVARDPNLFDNQYFLVFATQDKGSGIKEYQVQERKFFKEPAKRGWITAESPYLLKDQRLRSYISVRAIDKSGNERLAALSPQNPTPFYKNYTLWVIIIVLGLLVWYSGIWRNLRRFFKRYKNGKEFITNH